MLVVAVLGNAVARRGGVAGCVLRTDREQLRADTAGFREAVRERDDPYGGLSPAQAADTVTIARAELESLRAEVRRLRRQIGRDNAVERIRADAAHSDDALIMAGEQLAEAWGITR